MELRASELQPGERQNLVFNKPSIEICLDGRTS
jgi:hypothetical protein